MTSPRIGRSRLHRPAGWSRQPGRWFSAADCYKYRRAGEARKSPTAAHSSSVHRRVRYSCVSLVCLATVPCASDVPAGSQPEIDRQHRRLTLSSARVPAGAARHVLFAPSCAGFFFPLEAMEVTGKSKSGEAGRKALVARADARASQLAPIVAELRRGGITSWYGIAMALNKRGIPTATGRGIWEPGQVRRVMARIK